MENNKEKLDRLELMVNDKYGKWDLSDNDIQAIKYAVSFIKTNKCLPDPKCSWCGGEENNKGGLTVKVLHAECYESVLNEAGLI